MTKELIEKVKDRDYFYNKAETSGNKEAWNIAKYLRNVTNFNIQQAKKDFILHKLNEHENDANKFWKVIHKVVPSNKLPSNQDILLKHNGSKIDRFINDYFINVGKIDPLDANIRRDNNVETGDPTTDPLSQEQTALPFEPAEVTEPDVLKVIKEINVSKSSGLDNISSFIIKEAFQILNP